MLKIAERYNSKMRLKNIDKKRVKLKNIKKLN